MTEHAAGSRPPAIDSSRPHPARRYNYWLGGKDHFAADRESGDQIAAVMPSIRTAALENRAFLGRAAGHIARQGVRQFLDIGTGIPAPGNTHEIVQAVDPQARIVYADNDPLVLTHARALMAGTPGTIAYLDADLRDPASILDHPDLHKLLDLSEPVGLLLIAVLHFVRDDEDADGVVAQLLDRLPAGSWVAASHATWEHTPEHVVAELQKSNRDGRFVPRDGHRFADLFAGRIEIVEPGVVSVADWHNDNPARAAAADVMCNALVGRKP
ncbi:SAM-dependent methyltransferase [Actinoplanes sichuanensis]|uniref:SAM-dependent methyltransferase n=1 Tax=Actinoplanes sichuanensis TaxID=512349 RepID=A0ABW4ANU4_9ACTN|nr:SAM-dependent methyltransferase [Actinoplanes sichuanensis]